MARSTRWWVLVTMALGAQGCASPLASFERALEDAGIAHFAEPGYSGQSVEVRGSLEPGCPAGRGAVVSDRHVLTVAHVLNGHAQGFVATHSEGGWVEGRIVRRIAGQPEDLVLLELEVDEGWFGVLLGFDGFESRAILSPSPTGFPAKAITGRGIAPWRRNALVPGDSGSPVVDDEGRLVGIVSGRRDGVPVHVPLAPLALPDDAGPVLAAAR